jgi:hypothetical protein
MLNDECEMMRIKDRDFLCDLCDYLAAFAVKEKVNRKGR